MKQAVLSLILIIAALTILACLVIKILKYKNEKEKKAIHKELTNSIKDQRTCNTLATLKSESL